MNFIGNYFNVTKTENKIIQVSTALLGLMAISCFFISIWQVKMIFYVLSFIVSSLILYGLVSTVYEYRYINEEIENSDQILLAENINYQLFGNFYEYWLYNNSQLIVYKCNVISYVIEGENIYCDKDVSIQIVKDQYIIQYLDKIINIKI